MRGAAGAGSLKDTMAAIDINAEREKIQREIEALEKSLGPDVATIDVVVSDSSLDSEDDDFDNEDNLDGELLKGDVEWEEGSDKAEMCLQMNLVYQAVIEEKIQEVELLIAQNKEQQEELLWQIAGHKVSKSGDNSKTCPFLYMGHFMKPYFKDKVTGVGPPANPDMHEKASLGIKSFEELCQKQWKSQDKKDLRTAVISDNLQRMLQPKLLKLEYLQMKMDSEKDINKQILAKQICETEREIDDINQLSEDVLVAERTAEHDWEKISNINFEGAHSAEKLRKIWQNSEHPHISKKEWKEEEVTKLLEIAAKQKYVNWQAITQELGTKRTAFQCLQKYQQLNKDFRRKEFTKEEDDMLTHLVQQMRVGNHIPYRRISYFMEGREPMQLLCRWSKTLNPSLKRGNWSPSEDELLLKAVSKYGEKDWYKIQNEVPGRSDVQCRERYMKGLHADLKKGKWSVEEKNKLLELIEKHGVGHWSKVSSELTHRTGSQCLSKWKSLMGFFKRSPGRQRKKKAVIDARDSDTSSSGSCSEESESDIDMYAEEVEDEEEKKKKVDVKVKKPVVYRISSLDEWVPSQKNLDEPKKTHMKQSGSFIGDAKASRLIVHRKGKDGSFQFNTILKGIAYPHSTDNVIEDATEFLNEAAESGRNILQIGEEEIRRILRRNTKLRHEKQVHRAELKLSDSSEALCIELETEEGSKKQDSSPHRRLDKDTIDRRLLMAVTPWVGNVFLPLSTSLGRPCKKPTKADMLSKRLHTITLTSTPIFTFFIQFFQIDAEGCLEIIRARKSQQAYYLRKRSPNTPQGAGQNDPMSPHSLLAQTLNGLNHSPRTPSSRRGRSSSSSVKALGPVQKPKTVFELLKEKRMRESMSKKAQNAPAQPPNTPAQPPNTPAQPQNIPGQLQNVILPQPNAIQPNTNTAGQTVPLPLSSSPALRGVWPVMPTSPAHLPRPPIALMPTVVGNTNVNNTAMPITWIVTPQGLVPLQVQTLGLTRLNPTIRTVSPECTPILATGCITKAPVANLAPSMTAETKAEKNDDLGSSTLKSGESNSSGSVLPLAAQASSNKSVSGAAKVVPCSFSPTFTIVPTPNSSTFTPSPPVAGPHLTMAPSLSPVSNNLKVHSVETSNLPALVSSTSPNTMLAPSSTPASDNLKVHSIDSKNLPGLAPTTSPGVQGGRILPTDLKVKIVSASNLTKVSQPASSNTTPKTPLSSSEKNVLDFTLVALEDTAAVKEWIKGTKGVEIPNAKSNMAHLPPSVCTLKTLSRLLVEKRTLEETACKLLPPVEGNKEKSTHRQIDMVQELVNDKLKDNPAFLLLKQRFLSAFTLSGFLATLPPCQGKKTTDDPQVKSGSRNDDIDDSTDSDVEDEEEDRTEDVKDIPQHSPSEGQGEFSAQSHGPASSVDNVASPDCNVRRTRKRAYPQKWT
ncbi:snRNA-activating protein complex subunit 4 isoform X1 [Pelobates fuscus]|uniref:snRNA-activating protein complex subunit 4 isoform X1 n=2 Tax=Pelobates fuscus TaxID=191477 RepID=UPI002FE4AFF8